MQSLEFKQSWVSESWKPKVRENVDPDRCFSKTQLCGKKVPTLHVVSSTNLTLQGTTGHDIVKSPDFASIFSPKPDFAEIHT